MVMAETGHSIGGGEVLHVFDFIVIFIWGFQIIQN